MTLISPSAYTDYAEVGSIVAQELKSAGIDATFQGLTVNAWNADVAAGDFSISEHWSNNGLTPYNLYDNWLDSSLASGNNATGDYERLKNPDIDAALAKLAGDSTVEQQTADLVPIETYVAAQPAGDPDHDGVGVVRVQLAALRGLADPAESVRDRTAVGHQQQRGIRHRRGRHPAPAPAQLSAAGPAATAGLPTHEAGWGGGRGHAGIWGSPPRPAQRARPWETGGGPHPTCTVTGNEPTASCLEGDGRKT